MDSWFQTKALKFEELAVETDWLSPESGFLESLVRSDAPELRLSIPASSSPFPGYKLLEMVGKGGFGAVYRARDELLERIVALKILLPQREQPGGAPARERLLNEARILAAVRHPGIPVLFNVLERDGACALVTEFIDGQSLARMLGSAGPVGADEAVRLGASIASILADLHQAGIVHGDLKTSNLLLERSGRIVLTDFGLSQKMSPDIRQNGLGHITGSPLFMAPEQIQGEPLGPQTDVYGLGVVLYNMATGRFPVVAENLRELFSKIKQGRFAPVETWRPELPGRFIDAVNRAIRPDPRDRFQTARQMEQALRYCA